MLSRLQGVLLRVGTRQACRAASTVDMESLAYCRQMSTDAAAASQVDRLAADADAAAPDAASRQPVSQLSSAADSEDQHDNSARPQAPDPLEMFRQSNVSMPRLEGQVRSSTMCWCLNLCREVATQLLHIDGKPFKQHNAGHLSCICIWWRTAGTRAADDTAWCQPGAQVVKARIVAVDQKTVTLDSGYKYTSTLFKREMSGVPIYDEEGVSHRCEACSLS